MRPPVIVVICLLLICPAPGQVAPAHRAGGGFTQPDPIDFNDHDGFTQIFDGKTLNGWTPRFGAALRARTICR